MYKLHPFYAISAICLLLIIMSGCTSVECPKCPDCSYPDRPVQACQEKEKVLFMCPDKRIVENADECIPVPPPNLIPVTTNEEGTPIAEVRIKPECFKDNQGGIIFYNLTANPAAVTVQVKEDKEFRDVYLEQGKMKGDIYFTFYNKTWAGNFQLDKDKVYIMRLKFDFMQVYGKYLYSNEHLVDGRPGSEYIAKPCALAYPFVH